MCGGIRRSISRTVLPLLKLYTAGYEWTPPHWSGAPLAVRIEYMPPHGMWVEKLQSVDIVACSLHLQTTRTAPHHFYRKATCLLVQARRVYGAIEGARRRSVRVVHPAPACAIKRARKARDAHIRGGKTGAKRDKTASAFHVQHVNGGIRACINNIPVARLHCTTTILGGRVSMMTSSRYCAEGVIMCQFDGGYAPRRLHNVDVARGIVQRY